MARRKKKKKNPSTAQWVVLGVGGAIGLGLIGYGVYLGVKQKSLPATQISTWEYEIAPGAPVAGKLTFMARVFKPDGTIAVVLPNYPVPSAAIAAAIAYVKGQGGVPIERVA